MEGREKMPEMKVFEMKIYNDVVTVFSNSGDAIATTSFANSADGIETILNSLERSENVTVISIFTPQYSRFADEGRYPYSAFVVCRKK